MASLCRPQMGGHPELPSAWGARGGPEKGLSVGCSLCCDHTPIGGNNGLNKNLLGKRALEGKVWCPPPWGEG